MRYGGPPRTIDGVPVAPGDEGVVTHGVLRAALTPPHLRAHVPVRFPAGTVDVPAATLTPLPSDHPWRPEPDGAPAREVLAELAPWRDRVPTVASFVPVSDGHGVAQVLHRWDTQADDPAGIAWRVVADGRGTDRASLSTGSMVSPVEQVSSDPTIPEAGSPDVVTARRLVELLGPATSTPEDVFAIPWVGWGGLPRSAFPGAANVPDPNHSGREGFLLRGPLHGLAIPLDEDGRRRGAMLWWPADRAWVAACEIDLPWTYVCGPPTLIRTLVDDDVLEAVGVSPRAPCTEVADDPPGAP